MYAKNVTISDNHYTEETIYLEVEHTEPLLLELLLLLEEQLAPHGVDRVLLHHSVHLDLRRLVGLILSAGPLRRLGGGSRARRSGVEGEPGNQSFQLNQGVKPQSCECLKSTQNRKYWASPCST